MLHKCSSGFSNSAGPYFFYKHDRLISIRQENKSTAFPSKCIEATSTFSSSFPQGLKDCRFLQELSPSSYLLLLDLSPAVIVSVDSSFATKLSSNWVRI
ncbi:hypothetical protein HanXRQr2_Chr01g0027991 [Helianthus annuus]|uniref:Uncharacterized protein n=1 Tax=Helianthus annuus TaxID=4232 RepID=A0A251VQF2_HELAN|nr:hypothetical protein HanXRQr2_Chr01g0027991 [Helianthus annuus]KAJ0627379.1 hypothetical protein HanHA89_Chr01g0024721 [Helianthus annuus]KAJ0783687.1 hypothetical protein HanLR1_Chr01g0023281 [Helianthus annuus]